MSSTRKKPRNYGAFFYFSCSSRRYFYSFGYPCNFLSHFVFSLGILEVRHKLKTLSIVFLKNCGTFFDSSFLEKFLLFFRHNPFIKESLICEKEHP